MNDDLTAWRTERNRILRDLDVTAARALMPTITDNEVALMALHKARYECKDITENLRHDSRTWLESRGYSRFHDFPWPALGQLPE